MISLFLAMLPATMAALPSLGPTAEEPKEPIPPLPDKSKLKLIEFDPIVSQGQIKLPSGPLKYDATFASMPIESETGEREAALSYTYYRRTGTADSTQARPMMFLFNGGPGSASVWLHLGGIGPQRVEMSDEGGMLPPPFRTIENLHTWLDLADLVFIDPVDTGFSRAASEELRKKSLSVDGDLALNAEFVRRFLTRHQRWSSPLFLAGESYGTFRSAGLAGQLIESGIAFNGIILVSSVLELGTLLFESGDDLPFVVYLPAYAATAWYHKRLSDSLQKRPLNTLLAEVERWATGPYAEALAAGANLSGKERTKVVTQLAHFTGLSKDVIEEHDLRIDGVTFRGKLLPQPGKVVGRLDSRHSGFDPVRGGSGENYDPSMSAIRAPFTAAFNEYVRSTLQYRGEEEYHVLRGLEWNWGDAEAGAPRTNQGLESALARNPYLHVLVTSGYYDLATPYFATHYTFRRLRHDRDLSRQIRLLDYSGGHMTYLALPEMRQMHDDVSEFMRGALAVPARPLS